MQAVNDPLGLGEGPLLALTVKYLYIKSINHPQEWTTTNGEAGHTYKTEYFHTGYSTNLRASRLLLYSPYRHYMRGKNVLSPQHESVWPVSA